MITISVNTAAAIALHAAGGSWVMFLQAMFPLGRQGPIKIEGLRGAHLAERLISISRDSPCDVSLIGLLPSPIDPTLHASEIANELTCVHDQWYSPTTELIEFIENSAQATIKELLGQTSAGALDDLVDITGIAELLDVSVPTIRRMIDRDEIPFLKFGRSYRFVPSDVISSLRR